MFSKLRATATNTIFYSASNFAGKLSGVILLPLYTSSLSVELFGLFTLFEMIFQIIQGATGLGLKGGLTRWYWDEEHRHEQKEIVFSVFSTYFLVNAMVSVLLYFAFDLLVTLVFQVPVTTELKVIFLVSTFFRLMVELVQLLMQIQHKALKHTNYQLVQIVLFVASVAVFLSVLDLGVEGVFLAYFVSYLIPFVLLIPYVKNNMVWRYRRQQVKDMMRFGFPIAVGNMVNLTLSLSDKYIIRLFGTLGNVGNYALAFKIANIVQLLIVSAFMSSYTHMYYKSMGEDDNNRFFSRSLLYLVLFLSFVSLGLVLFIEDVVKVLTINNTDYLDSIAIIPVLTLGLIFGGVRSMLSLPLAKYKKTKVISALSMFAGVVNVGLNILMVPRWGTMGAAVSTLMVQIVSVLMFWKFASRYESKLLDMRKLVLILVLTVALGALTYVELDLNFFMTVALKGMVLGVWLLAIWNMRIFNEVEKLRIKQGWEKWRHVSQLKSNIQSLKND